jgi:hypothetical protein
MRIALPFVTSALLLVACSSSTTEPPFAGPCHIGELTGTWHVTYAETDGNCGPVPAETVVLSASMTASAMGPKCTINADQVSADKCRLDSDFTCPLNGAVGTQRWVGATHQTGPGSLSSSWTVSTTGAVVCRSTYTLTWVQQ